MCYAIMEHNIVGDNPFLSLFISRVHYSKEPKSILCAHTIQSEAEDSCLMIG